MSPPGARATARAGWILILAAAAVLMVTNGARQSLGLYIAPIHTATGIAFADISLALAVGQFVWGLAQPLFGAFADRTPSNSSRNGPGAGGVPQLLRVQCWALEVGRSMFAFFFLPSSLTSVRYQTSAAGANGRVSIVGRSRVPAAGVNSQVNVARSGANVCF